MAETATPSLRRNMMFAAIANAVFAMTQWGILTVVARLGTPAEVGAITLVTAITTPVFLFAQMAMRDGHSVDDLVEFTRADYVALRLVASLFALGVVGILIVTYLPPSGILVQSSAAAFALVKLMGAQTDMNHGIFQRAERLDYVAWSMVARGVMGLAGFTVCYWLTRNLPVSFVVEALMWWGTVLTVDRRYINRLQAHVSLRTAVSVPWRRIYKLARWMLPLGLAILLMTASSSVPILMLERHTELAVVGVFGAIAYINIALNTFSGAIGTASAARLRRLYRQGDKHKFLRLSIKLTLLSACLGGLLWLVAIIGGEAVLRLLYGNEYARADIFQISVLAAAMRIATAPMQFAMTAGQAFWRRMSNSGFTFIVALGASFVLIPSHGEIGAALALVILSATNLVLTTLSFVQVVKRVPSIPNESYAA